MAAGNLQDAALAAEQLADPEYKVRPAAAPCCCLLLLPLLLHLLPLRLPPALADLPLILQDVAHKVLPLNGLAGLLENAAVQAPSFKVAKDLAQLGRCAAATPLGRWGDCL